MSVAAQYPIQPRTLESPVSPISASSSNHTRNRSHIPETLGTPPIPPRTSSNQRNHRHHSGATSSSSSTEKVTGSRHAKHKTDAQDQNNRGRSANGRETMDESDIVGETPRRKGPLSSHGPHITAIDEAHDRLSSVNRSRSDVGLGTASGHGSLIKESSTIINQVVITDPSIDLEREQARQLEAQPSPAVGLTPVTGLGLVSSDGVDDGGRGGMRSRHDYSANHPQRRKETTFGQYVLGQTIGEGEFGKVKLGWKKDGSVQVAIKLIRREVLGSNPGRLPKIYREISILQDLSHPNIVRLHEMVETDRHIGLIMEYASGGELFDYILKNRYLKDQSARRLFAQLVSGVGYLHKKGIVHRDLKLENLLLDRNRNIIITDFGFANTFNPNDELGEEIEYNLTNKDFVKRMRLDKTDPKGMRRGDLMQTSCGSPCYAAPELVVSDSLYTGRKVDVWSCGVILYAMLAGYLPFDDDPANPEGDNINLLYKYIVTTPLTFPEYITPHARDLLRRILVPDPRNRADLFEVARHSWLSEFSHIVSHITSTTTNISDIATTTVPAEDAPEGPSLARSASVREPPKSYQSSVATIGGLNHQQGKIGTDEPTEKPKPQRDTKRRTVQVEYVAPQSQTTRGESSSQNFSGPFPTSSGISKTGTGSGSRDLDQSASLAPSQVRSQPKESLNDSSTRAGYTKAPSASQIQASAPGNLSRPIPESAGVLVGMRSAQPQGPRPNTGHSTTSLNAGRLPSRGSYGQPVAPTVAATNAQGRLAQPKNGKQYVISSPIPQDPSTLSIGRPSTQQLPAKFNPPARESAKSHKRSSTVTGISEKIFGKSASIFGNRTTQMSASRPKPKRCPPTSMKDPYSNNDSRASMDSRRSMSIGFNRRQAETSSESRPRRFSLLPPSLSLKGFSSGNKEQQWEGEPQMTQVQGLGSPIFGRQQRPSTGPSGHSSRLAGYGTQGSSGTDQGDSNKQSENRGQDIDYEVQVDRQLAASQGSQQGYQRDYQYQPPDHDSQSDFRPQNSDQSAAAYQQGFNSSYEDRSRQSIQPGRLSKSGILQKNNRKFADAYEYERDSSHHSGSSGAARKVMEFFRRRGKARTGDDR